MEALWAPWRMDYLLGEPPEGCVFCVLPEQQGMEADRTNLIIGRSAKSFVILNRFPYNNGHVMVVPRRHTADYASLDPDELWDLHRLLQISLGVVERGYRPQGFNVGLNLGRIAGAGIAEHMHFHIVPRWGGDTNFMPAIGQTKVMVEHLQQSFDRLRPLFDEALATPLGKGG